jgi:hypothetical protein
MHREAKRTLPRPKVGDFCSTAMEQGFSDACVALCLDQVPVARVSQTCRAAAIEMPRPTVRRWCEHGYNVAFSKTMKDLSGHFKASDADVVAQNDRPFLEEHPAAASGSGVSGEAGAPRDVYQEQHGQEHRAGAGAGAAVVATIPVTLEDNTTTDLVVHEGQNAEEAVVEFCREHVADDVGGCIRQLLTVVIEKLNELSLNA